MTPASVSSPIDGREKGVKTCNVSTRVEFMKDFYFFLDAFHRKRLGGNVYQRSIWNVSPSKFARNLDDHIGRHRDEVRKGSSLTSLTSHKKCIQIYMDFALCLPPTFVQSQAVNTPASGWVLRLQLIVCN